MGKPNIFKTLFNTYKTGKTYDGENDKKEDYSDYRLTEAYEVMLRQKPNNPDDVQGEPEVFEVANKDIHKIRSLSQISAHAGEAYIDSWLEAAHFLDPNYRSSLLNVMSDYSFNWVNLKKFINLKVNGKAKIKLKDLFGDAQGQFNLFDKYGELWKYVGTIIERDERKYTEIKKGKGGVSSQVRADDLNQEQSGKRFVRSLMNINHAIAGTSVGDGEFMLAMLTDGVKGETGDIDATYKPIPGESEGSLTDGKTQYEIGTQTKVFYGAHFARVAGDASLVLQDERNVRGMWNRIVEDLQEWVGQESAAGYKKAVKGVITTQVTKTFGATNVKDHLQEIINELVRGYDPADILGSAAQPRGPGTASNARPILAAAALYDYIISHGDHYIVILNYGSQVKTQTIDEYYTKYLQVINNWSGTLKAIKDGFFWVTIDGRGVFRIEVRA